MATKLKPTNLLAVLKCVHGKAILAETKLVKLALSDVDITNLQTINIQHSTQIQEITFYINMQFDPQTSQPTLCQPKLLLT